MTSVDVPCICHFDLQVCNEKRQLESINDHLRVMFNHATVELSYFHEKELQVRIFLVE